jgi:hypothetical protein
MALGHVRYREVSSIFRPPPKIVLLKVTMIIMLDDRIRIDDVSYGYLETSH